MSTTESIEESISGVPLAEAVFDAGSAVVDGNGLGAVGGAVDTVLKIDGVVTDPIGSFAAAGVGWVIEHIPVLKEALDAVSGDEEAINAVKTVWEQKVALPLDEVSKSVKEAGAATASGFTGVDADAYRTSTAKLAVETSALAYSAKSAATGISFAGAMVIEVRNWIRDELSKFLAWTLAKMAAAAAASVPTAGSSVVAATNSVLLQGAMLGQKFARMLQKLTSKLETLAGKLSSLGNATQALRRVSAGIDGVAARTTTALDNGAVINTAFRLAGDKPTFNIGAAAVDLGIAEVKAAGDTWVTNREVQAK